MAARKTGKRQQFPTLRSSAAEYLTFVAASGGGEQSIEMRYEDENLWLTQKMMAALYDVTVPAINQHLKRIFTDQELTEPAVIKKYLTTAADGKNYTVIHYNLQAIVAVGFKVNNERAELQAMRKIPMSMQDWARRLDGFLEFNGNEILTGPGKISHEQARLHAETEFEKYRVIQDRLFQSDFDRFLALEEKVKVAKPEKKK